MPRFSSSSWRADAEAQRRTAGWVTLAVIGATFASLIPFSSTHVEVSNGLIAVDRFALFFKIVFLIAAAYTVLISTRYLAVEGASPGEYYFLVLCATLGMMIMAGGIDLIRFHRLREMGSRSILEGFTIRTTLERGGVEVLHARSFSLGPAVRNSPVRAVGTRTCV